MPNIIAFGVVGHDKKILLWWRHNKTLPKNTTHIDDVIIYSNNDNYILTFAWHSHYIKIELLWYPYDHKTQSVAIVKHVLYQSTRTLTLLYLLKLIYIRTC